MNYDPNKVFTSLLKWYEGGSATNEIPTNFNSDYEEQRFVFAIEEIFDLCRQYSKNAGQKDG